MDERARLRALERENRELRQANEILRQASACFAAAELERRSKSWLASPAARWRALCARRGCEELFEGHQ